MKRLIAGLLALVMVRTLAGCGRQTVTEAPQNIKPDLSYWQENLESAEADMGVGNSSHGGIATAEEILSLMESIELYNETSVSAIGSMDYTCHGITLTNPDENRNISFTFYDDFNYVAIDENGRKVDQSPLYSYSDSEKIKQFFTDKGLYMPPAIRTVIEDKLYNIIKNGDVQQINDKVEPSLKDGSIVNISPAATPERVIITNVLPVNYGYGCYEADVEIAYDYGAFQRIYYAFIYLDENLDIKTVYLTENTFDGEIISPYTIGDVDYSLWMEKADSCYHDFFRFWLGAGSSAHCESAMEWRTAVLRCIKDLSLGELVDINTADYPRNQQYRIVLEEGSEYYQENPLVLEFYDDCRYVIVCNCQQDEDNPVSVCGNHTKAYKVNNPEMVRRTFSLDGQYVSPRDYESLQKFAQDTMENTSVEKLNKMSDNDRNILEGWQFVGNVANFAAESTDHLSLEDGREKFTVSFTTMYRKAVNENQNEHISYNVRMQVYRSGNSWKITSAYIY